jgi:hypothetical protein
MLLFFYFFKFNVGIRVSLRAPRLINPTGPKVNDHVSLKWSSYEQPHGSNLRPQREQTSWSQALTTEPPPRWFAIVFNIMGCRC